MLEIKTDKANITIIVEEYKDEWKDYVDSITVEKIK